MVRTSRLLGALFLIASIPVSAATYKWVDENGRTQYGDSIPAQYSSKGATELDKQGQVVKKYAPALTPAQIKAKEDEAVQKKDDEQKAAAQKRKDSALINTYSNEKEIDGARDRNLQLLEATIKTAQTRLGDLQVRIKQSPGNKDIEKEMQTLQTTIAEKRTEITAITARFEADKQRYRELSAGGPQPQAKKP